MGTGGYIYEGENSGKKLGKNHSKITPVFMIIRKTWIRYEGFWKKPCALIWRNMGRDAGIRRVEAVLSKESMEEQAGAGKITFGLSFQDKVPDYRRQRRMHASVLKMG